MTLKFLRNSNELEAGQNLFHTEYGHIGTVLRIEGAFGLTTAVIQWTTHSGGKFCSDYVVEDKKLTHPKVIIIEGEKDLFEIRLRYGNGKGVI